MTDEDKDDLAAVIAGELEDSCGIDTAEYRDITARRIVDRIEPWLYGQGWRPPETYDRIVRWSEQTATLPEHHINQPVLISQLAELSDILRDRHPVSPASG